ncbi:MAG: hypothetical protein R3D67_08010 [Hyphomicrobiaceae bacterium]
MTFEATVVADALVNFFGAAGAYVLAREIYRADPFGPVTRRIAFALRFVAVFFLLRSFSWATGDRATFDVADVLGAATPLVSLIVAEGLLRRHAPKWLKLSLLGAPVLLAVAKVVPLVPSSATIAVLVASVFGGFLGVAGLLWRRDTSSLTSAENTNIRQVLFALLLLAPLILTDFRSVWPDVPIRLGAVGALMLLYFGFGAGNLQAGGFARAGTVAVFVAIAAVFGWGYAVTTGGGEFSHIVRVAAVGFSGLLFAAIYSEAKGALGERQRKRGPLLDAATPSAFEAGLRAHPLLGGAHVLSGQALSHVADATLDSLLAEKPVLHRTEAPWGRSPTDEGVERALSLMTAYDSTDLAVLTRTPLRLLVVSLPAIARDVRSEGELQLARLVGELAYMKADLT